MFLLNGYEYFLGFLLIAAAVPALALVTRERHRIKLNECLKEIDNFLKKDQNKDLELAAEDLRMATRHLGSIVGKVDVEEILGSIFKDFCIGK